MRKGVNGEKCGSRKKAGDGNLRAIRYGHGTARAESVQAALGEIEALFERSAVSSFRSSVLEIIQRRLGPPVAGK
jgi:hypothetical protein